MVVWGAQTRSMDRDASFRCLESGPPLGVFLSCITNVVVILTLGLHKRNTPLGTRSGAGHTAGQEGKP